MMRQFVYPRVTEVRTARPGGAPAPQPSRPLSQRDLVASSLLRVPPGRGAALRAAASR
jgi:hypothetical protein